MTPDQMDQWRRMMMAQTLLGMGRSSVGPTSSPMGAVNQAISPMLGAALAGRYLGGGGQPGYPGATNLPPQAIGAPGIGQEVLNPNVRGWWGGMLGQTNPYVASAPAGNTALW